VDEYKIMFFEDKIMFFEDKIMFFSDVQDKMIVFFNSV
jgi:hypothetical protein